MLFEKDLKITGKHSILISELKDSNVFPTYREIYTISTAVGYLFGEKVAADRTENVKPSTIFASDLAAQKPNLRFLYRLIMLTEDQEGFTLDDYKNRAFRDDAIEDNEDKMRENMEIFNSYFRGGLEKITDLLKDCDTPKERVNEIYSFLYDMCVDYNYIKDDE